MIRLAMIGGGWRAAFYVRVARALPDRFQIAGVYLRNAQKRNAFAQQFNVPVCASLDELLTRKCDYIVVATDWQSAYAYNLQLFSLGIPVLSETPPAPTEEALDCLWKEYQSRGARIQVAEQYYAQPYISGVLSVARSGLIGKPVDITLSMVHGYHAVNVIRRLLDVGFETCRISGKRYFQPVKQTTGRKGFIENGKVEAAARDVVQLEFENGCLALYDFCGEQYFSQLRSRYLRLCGDAGEIFNQQVRYVNQDGDFAQSEFHRVELGREGNLEGYSLRGIQLDGRYVYRNPFAEPVLADQIRLSDEELAVAQVMEAMGEYVRTGKEFYPFAQACQDSYLSLLMTQAAAEGSVVCSKRKAWVPLGL
ncbi:MAG TPA: Gfo/Idh/MocA family oxidoreductase [Candidatus Gallacutalibacter stercoravium]|nr:Gfo/Idh/MocA family oxidoreductase [Candidatus Gallacutalibacter stercoravium]